MVLRTMSSKRFPNIMALCAMLSVFPPTHRPKSPPSLRSLFPSYRRPSTADLAPDPCRQNHRYHHLIRIFMNFILFNWCCGVQFAFAGEQHRRQQFQFHLRATNKNSTHLPRYRLDSNRSCLYCFEDIQQILMGPVSLTLQVRPDINVSNSSPTHPRHLAGPLQQPTTTTTNCRP